MNKNFIFIVILVLCMMSCDSASISKTAGDEQGSTWTGSDGATSDIDGEEGSDTDFTAGTIDSDDDDDDDGEAGEDGDGSSGTGAYTDSDGDGYSDAVEENSGTDPNDASDYPDAGGEGGLTFQTLGEYFDENPPENGEIEDLESQLAARDGSLDDYICIEPRSTSSRDAEAEVADYLEGVPYVAVNADQDDEDLISYLSFTDTDFRMYTGSKSNSSSVTILEGTYTVFDGYLILLQMYSPGSVSCVFLFSMEDAYISSLEGTTTCPDGSSVTLEEDVNSFDINGEDASTGFNYGNAAFSRAYRNECEDGDYPSIEELLAEE
jgi:hypothetical protein